MDTRGAVLGMTRPGREAHSPPFSAEVKNERTSSSTLHTPSWRVQGQH